MYAQEKFARYINRFTTRLQQHATAILEFKWKDGKVTVNLSHDLWSVEKSSPNNPLQISIFRRTQKKAVKPSQLRRLQKRAAARAEQSLIVAGEQAQSQNIESEKTVTDQFNIIAKTAEKARNEKEQAGKKQKLSWTKL